MDKWKIKFKMEFNGDKFCVYRNPNEHHRQDPVLLASKERNRFRSVTWDEYDSVHQKYLEIGKERVDSIQKKNNLFLFLF